MKILHFNINPTLIPGIFNQLCCENDSKNDIKTIQWEIKIFSHNNSNLNIVKTIPKKNYPFPKLINYFVLRYTAYKWLKKVSREYDYILLRYSYGDILQYIMCWNIDNLITVHHTLEEQEIKTQAGIVPKIQYAIESYLGPYFLKKNKGIIGVTDEIISYELQRLKVNNLQSFLYPNGICVDDNEILDNRGGDISLLFVVSSYSAWHGFEILYDQIKKSTENFELHIVGNIHKRYQMNDARVKYHGFLDQEQLTKIYAFSDIGISTLALEKKGMKEACTLKTREYLNNGIPVYASHIDPVFPEGFPYFICQKLQLHQLIQKAVEFRVVSKESIKDASKPFINKANMMKKLVRELEKSV